MAALPLLGCAGELSVLQPAGPIAGSIATLSWVMMIGSLLLTALMTAIFFFVVWWPQRAARISARAWIIGGGLILPGLVLPPLVVAAVVVGERMMPHDPVPRIEAHARQFFWTFRYPDHGGAETRDLLHLPAGQPVDIHITAEDVMHAFWVPRLAGKLDAVPGHTNVLRLQADAPGRLEGLCAEFCGLGHSHMRFEVRVHAPDEFAAAVAAETTPSAPEAQP
ncbi:cytochrome c oxidase subunit II [Roseococcus microcysteis]|uniref:cytochrome c oxidase subunit II n=1 Tax=Roseococcus microcysteis TaxID=2771361 RepID=UPI001CC59C9D|nr:cytochrome c oxidase subunit II [Roseococcus microcysteis]